MMSRSNDNDAAAAVDLLIDAFGRIRQEVEAVLDGADEAMLRYRPDADANSIAWLVWHLTRIQDDHVQDLAGAGQAWVDRGWSERFSLPFDVHDTGYGHTSAQVAQVHASAELLAGYHADVHELTIDYVERLDAAELARIVDTRWDPPVTASARLVSVIGDCQQHLGQAAYVRGLYERQAG
jgi:hypothetical protein